MMRVFVSSTSEDLTEYRQAARDAIAGLQFTPVDMISWSADPRSGAELSLDRVRRSDVLVLLLAHRYGYVPAGAAHSITEQEYRAARAAGLPVLAFFLDPAVPWPPDQVQWESRKQLAAFRGLVESEVTRTLFRSPAELATQLVQALALLERAPRTSGPVRRFTGRVREVSLPSALTERPDVLVPIGPAEDGLPLLLDVRRSRDLTGPLDTLAATVDAPGLPSPTALFDTFRQSLQEHANRAWAAERIRSVLSFAGDYPRTGRFYVSSFTLTQPFASILASLASTPAGSRVHVARPRAKGALQTLDRGGISSVRSALQSTGGSNRFLAVSPADGLCRSVGWVPDQTLVTWRPFVPESAPATFPQAAFTAQTHRGPVIGGLPEAPGLLMAALHDAPRDDLGRFGVELTVQVPVAAVVSTVVAVATKLHAEIHTAGLVHGDVKPHNVLLTADGVELIDSFEVPIGQPAPGWTLDWSAPEQVLGLPVGPTADVYPLAALLGELFGGQLVGELRTYMVPGHRGAPTEHAVFHDPLLQVDHDEDDLPPEGVRAWRRLIERGLRFDPEQRYPSLAEFADEVSELAAAHPMPGSRSFQPSGELIATRLADGTDAVARAVFDPHIDRLSVPVPDRSSDRSTRWAPAP